MHKNVCFFLCTQREIHVCLCFSISRFIHALRAETMDHWNILMRRTASSKLAKREDALFVSALSLLSWSLTVICASSRGGSDLPDLCLQALRATRRTTNPQSRRVSTKLFTIEPSPRKKRSKRSDRHCLQAGSCWPVGPRGLHFGRPLRCRKEGQVEEGAGR